MRLRLLIAYDGKPFCGWQSQATGDSVQDHIEAVFQRVLGQPTRIHGAGRTDGGVHALGQVAHVDVPDFGMPPAQWSRALNDHLPPGIRIIRSTRAHATFHARTDAIGKVYTYRIWHGSYLHPLEVGRAWLVPGKLDLARLREAAQLLVGEHDFANFAGNRREVENNTYRYIQEIALTTRGPLLTLRFRGNGFMYHMVRLLTGSIIRCARGREELSWLCELRDRKSPEKTRYCAPAEGLYLTRVLY
ncbi:MAG TPA: tRNA pseudouridine(38-40) synthase TruA [Chthoniobacteraceae bacterium]|nr:tRNA pseudouridine(38-40) synthase TruA [Chthoniobacteraceae bacterium]